MISKFEIQDTHARMVAKLEKDPKEILRDINPEDMSLLHMAVGVSGEAGELLDAIKKVAIYGKPIDRENVIEELGDLEFYMQGLRARLGISREQTLEHNLNKLLTGKNARYKEGIYSDAQAQGRRDKAVETPADPELYDPIFPLEPLASDTNLKLIAAGIGKQAWNDLDTAKAIAYANFHRAKIDTSQMSAEEFKSSVLNTPYTPPEFPWAFKILVLGHGRHGKDTFAEMLSKELGIKLAGSSEYCAEKVVFPGIGSQPYNKQFKSWKQCFDERGKNRTAWHEIIKSYNTPDKARLAKEICNLGNGYIGMRCIKEYEASMDARVFDAVIWVDATGRGVPTESPSSFTIHYDGRTMISADNNGTEADLAREVKHVASLLWKRLEYTSMRGRRNRPIES